MRLSYAVVILALSAACGGDSAKTADSTGTSGGDAAPVAAAGGGSFDPSTITPAMLALGDSLFHGLIGATSCQACHGPGGDQGTVAPILTDAEWLHGDGSYENIYNTIVSGVMAPKQFSSVMPPYGGIPMPEDRTRAVAAYVYKLSHK